jgi:formamidopyrimidine-DNA glycosylase
MPELPEVETIARQLRSGGSAHPPLPGRVIDAVTLRWPRIAARRRTDPAGDPQRTIRDVGRRGKYLVFPLDRGTLLIHLKMSGDLGLFPSVEPAGPYDHTVFHLDGGWDLRFGDARKFGKVFLLDDPARVLLALGPEPLSRGFTARSLARDLRRAPASRCCSIRLSSPAWGTSTPTKPCTGRGSIRCGGATR